MMFARQQLQTWRQYECGVVGYPTNLKCTGPVLKNELFT